MLKDDYEAPGLIPVLARKMASKLDLGHFKGPGEKPILEEGFFDPVSVNISLLLSGKVANAFLTWTVGSLAISISGASELRRDQETKQLYFLNWSSTHFEKQKQKRAICPQNGPPKAKLKYSE
ncbi:hypothetical protein DSO57_1025916 [Entomophthora muscae]|uniref:Uncharacterized protein n=1 Tax=Entomophthora muscae TaxID=34485 RepID=A0ACC2S471_9FUNG|nr:hypothetical protein DSO57_1025916 [Entomophthora muscae]